MARGGKRDGAGRRAGTINKASAAKRAEIEASGLTPLDYMLTVMRDEQNPADMRLDAAHKAAPFVHPKLAAVEHSGKIDSDNTHHVEGALSSLDQFLAEALGAGEASIPRGTRPN